MKKLYFLAALTLNMHSAQADPVAYGVIALQRSAANDDYTEYWMAPTPGTPCVFSFAGNSPYLPSCVAISQASASRSLNSSFQVSSTQGAQVSYSVRISTTSSLSGGQTGEVVLEIASDSGFSTDVQTLAIAESGQTVALAIAITVTNVQTSVVSGYVPPGYYVRLRTVNTAGSPSFTYRSGQETLVR